MLAGQKQTTIWSASIVVAKDNGTVQLCKVFKHRGTRSQSLVVHWGHRLTVSSVHPSHVKDFERFKDLVFSEKRVAERLGLHLLYNEGPGNGNAASALVTRQGLFLHCVLKITIGASNVQQIFTIAVRSQCCQCRAAKALPHSS